MMKKKKNADVVETEAAEAVNAASAMVRETDTCNDF